VFSDIGNPDAVTEVQAHERPDLRRRKPGLVHEMLEVPEGSPHEYFDPFSKDLA
jgi:hypothetical protein